jgi:purine-nucleoside phosphorylase
MTYYDRVQEAAASLRSRVSAAPDVAVVLGSGLGAVADALASPAGIDYADIPHWPVPSVPGHAGRFTTGTLSGRAVALLAGRAHLYEGHSAHAVAFATRVVATLGVRILVLTNAAGGINPGLCPGALMVIDDHINLTGANPIAGLGDARFGPMFPDMSAVYSPRLRSAASEASQAAGVPVHHGVYAALAGPSYETPAEIRYLASIGADAVGMSTAIEAIAARQMSVEVLGISCITNMAAGVTPGALGHDEVLTTGRRAAHDLARLLEATLDRL